MHKLKKYRYLWDTGRVSPRNPAGQTGSTGGCPRDILLFAIEKLTEKGILAGTPAGCPWPRGFQIFFVIFSYVPFLLSIENN